MQPLIRHFVDIPYLMNNSLVEIFGGIIKLILFIIGSIMIVSICIYFLIKEFNKVGIENGSTQYIARHTVRSDQ